MLPKAQRLTTKQFHDFFPTGRRFHSPVCTIVYTPHDTFRGAVVVGKKVHKRAVVRNTLRRRIYGQLYRQIGKKSKTGVFIVLTKPTANLVSRRELQLAVESAIAAVLKKA